jgi:gas vesicle protein
MESTGRDESGTVRAFMTGVLVGAGIALLFAPQAGTQLRGLLRERSTKELDEAIDRGANMLDHTIDRGHDLLEKGRGSVQQVRRRAKEFTKTGRKTGNDIKNELASSTQ